MEEENNSGLDDVIIIDPTNTQAIDAIFGGEEQTPEEDGGEPEDKGGKFIENNNKDNDNRKEHTEGEPGEGSPESVGDGAPSEGESTEGGNQENGEEAGEGQGSPDISSIAKAFRDEGLLFATLDEKRVSEISSTDDFRAAVEEDMKNRLDEQQRRLYEALDAGADMDMFQRYENAIAGSENYLKVLEGTTDDDLKAEDEDGVNIRRNLIYAAYMSKLGNNQKEAVKLTERSFSSGTDVDDAKEAIEVLKQIHTDRMARLKKERDDAVNKSRTERRENAERLRKSIMEEKFFGDIDVDDATRQKILRTATTRRKTDLGELTELEEAAKKDPVAFQKNLNALWVLTDGFQNVDALARDKARKEVNKSNKALDNLLKSGTFNGTPRFTSGVQTQPESQKTVKYRFAPDDDL